MDTIVKLDGNRFLNLNSGLYADFPAEDFARVTTPCGYRVDLHGDTATSLLWTLTDLAYESNGPNEDELADYRADQGT